ncbi:MAG: cell division protein FtsA [Bacteroidales bacterium]|jgi:cell division protein FtsA|nr:cell division protein FtsA [Lentimicrobiaceae bacterium]MDG1136594.1 cell division protein FtsA [Bacteroidales bacterium]MDG1901113.1 cell division protein FtsA [Bacteroidales bacterium]MDG2080557.1 cell division protein FtsA [Bacteroidales bacterium]|tara:strand:- start:10962 stop:12278 length:1317 start_codon:yes stop_codon:yes gene_type:complete
MESEIIVGLDIGTTKIACIVGTKNEFGKIDIMGYGKTESIGVKRGVVANIENTVQSIKKAVQMAEEKSGVAIKYVNVGIAGQHIKSHQHRGSIIRDDEDKEITIQEIDSLTQNMYKLSMAPGEEIIDVIPQDYIIDNESGIREPVGMLGNNLEANFHIIIAQTASAKNIYKCIKKADLEMVNLILEPIASAEAVLSEEEKEAGVVLVDIGGGTTDIAIFQDSIIRHSAVIPFGGDIVTEDVKEGCTIIKKHAEELKVKFGSALASENRDDEVVAIPGLRGRPPKEITLKNLASIIQARMEEIIDQVFFEIKNSGFEKKLIAGIVMTGGGSQLKHIDQLAEFTTGMATRIGYPNEHLAKDVIEEMASPMYATGIGLVIEGIIRFDIANVREGNLNSDDNSSGNDKAKKRDKRSKDGDGESGPSRFLQSLKNWFENDTSE